MVKAPLHHALSIAIEAVPHKDLEITQQLSGLGDVTLCLVEEGFDPVIEGRVAQGRPREYFHRAFVAPVVGQQGSVGAIDGADLAQGEDAVVVDGDGHLVVDEPQGGVGVYTVALLIIRNPATHVDGFAPLVGHDHAHRVDAHVARVLVNVVPIGQVHGAAALAQAHEVNHAVLAIGCEPTGAHIAVGRMSQQQGNALVRVVLHAPHRNNRVHRVHIHHLVDAQSLTVSQVEEPVRIFLAIVIIAELVTAEV